MLKGAGKGTHSSSLLSKYKMASIVVGDLLRDQITKGTRLGIEAKAVMAAGGLLPDETVVK